MVTSSKKTDVILVGVDGSDSSLDALQWAADQAKLAHASLEVLSAWEWPSVWGREPTWPPGWDPKSSKPCSTRRTSSTSAKSSLRATPPRLSLPLPSMRIFWSWGAVGTDPWRAFFWAR